LKASKESSNNSDSYLCPSHNRCPLQLSDHQSGYLVSLYQKIDLGLYKCLFFILDQTNLRELSFLEIDQSFMDQRCGIELDLLNMELELIKSH